MVNWIVDLKETHILTPGTCECYLIRQERGSGTTDRRQWCDDRSRKRKGRETQRPEPRSRQPLGRRGANSARDSTGRETQRPEPRSRQPLGRRGANSARDSTMNQPCRHSSDSFKISDLQNFRRTDVLTVPNLQWFHLTGFDFLMVQKWYEFSRNCTLHLEFWSFPELAIWGMILSYDSGQWQPHLPASHTIVRINNWYSTYNHPVPRQQLCFPLSVQYFINSVRYWTLFKKYTIGFVLADFAQP